MFSMNANEQLTLDVITKVFSSLMNRKMAQQVLGVSERTLERYLQAYRKEGPVFVKHGNCNKTPTNKTVLDLKSKVQILVKEKYYDFNMCHCMEKLREEQGIEVKRETFRKWCHEINMVKRAKRRRGKVRKLRERMEQTGLLLQMDGSPFRWFGGKPSCLIAAIDDADSEVPFGEFFHSEDTIGCMRVLQKVVEKKGIFQVLYVDRAGIFGGMKRAQFSQVKRALGELGIHVIFANSPEAKGRIERLWDTLQDRLVPEMRMRGIKTYEAANHFLQRQYLPNMHNPKFKVVPANLQTAYKLLPEGINLKEIFCLKDYRVVAKDHTISLNNETYQIDSPLKYSIYRQKIEIRTYQDLSWKAFFGGKEIKIKKVKKPQKATAKMADFFPEVEIHTERVRLDEHVRYLNHYYSVDKKYVGKKVSTCEKNGLVLIYHKGKLIEKRPKITDPDQLCSTKSQHLSAWQEAMKKGSIYRKTAIRQGSHVDKLILAMLNRGNGFIDNKSIWGVLDCEKYYPISAVNEACKYALEVKSPTLKAVKVFLRLSPNQHGGKEREKNVAFVRPSVLE